MNKKLIAELSKMEDYEFFALEYHFWMARLIRDTMSQNAIDKNTMAERLGVPVRKMNAVVNGAYPFDLRMMSKLQSYRQEIASAAAKFKVEAQDIQFTKYKEEYPLYVDRIVKLIEILEDKNKK